MREAAAEAARRYGTGACAPRATAGGMRVHRRLEARLADFTRGDSALLFGSGHLAALGAVGALAAPGEVVIGDGPGLGGAIDGARLAGAEWLGVARGALDELEWALRTAEGRAGLIATEGILATDGGTARLAEIVELAHRFDARVLVDESHALGTVGPGGRGTIADAGLEDEIDATVGSLGKALGSQGGYVCCESRLAKLLVNTAHSQVFSTAPAPPSTAAALAALELLADQPRRVEKLQRNAAVLRAALADEGIPASTGGAHIVALTIGGAADTLVAAERALTKGLFVEAARPPVVAEGGSALRLTVMSSHTKPELREAAQTLVRALPEQTRRVVSRRSVPAPAAPTADTQRVFDGLADAA